MIGHPVANCSLINNKRREEEPSVATDMVGKKDDLQPMQVDAGMAQQEKEPEAQNLDSLEIKENQFDWALAGPRRGHGRGRGPNTTGRTMEASQTDTWKNGRKAGQHDPFHSGVRLTRGGRGGHLGQKGHIPRDKRRDDPMANLSDKDFPPLPNPSRSPLDHTQQSSIPKSSQEIEAVVTAVSGPKHGLMLYGFSDPPPLDIRVAWSEDHNSSVSTNDHKASIYKMYPFSCFLICNLVSPTVANAASV
ncbi:hypothetical protein J5N97_000601 [Dioscorea zingiberensis]|uniref:Uncharacterized protein n=1 Tax=Dioscorea zingiberensis TaxID=325984 RepID=A0A9D5H2Z4_9LILI|nr:hypothetical protein J5N97_000601 [Dioscorea zingiberensis]